VSFIDDIKWDENNLVPVVVQDAASKDVLMVGWSNREAVEKMLSCGLATFWSRSRKKLWTKGESSGNGMVVKELRFDCDLDTIVALVEPKGPACHEGYRSCFFRTLEPIAADGELKVVGEREFDPKDVYGEKKG
jgi:phosphoribosyl-AMP cyclohydrolase